MPPTDSDTEMNDVFSGPPIEPHDLSQLQYHITLRDFGEKVQRAANAAYPNDQKIKYARVYALLILWEDEDPQLPVSLEVHELGVVLASIYNYDVQIYRIPSGGSHKKLNQKILDFVELGEDSKEDLKIVYYGGHGMLAQNRQPCWASRSNPRDPSFGMVKWGGIQNSLEEAQSDVLLLLDCCSSGTANTGDGCGTTELIAACGFNDVANGVGRHSFTHALTIELRLLSAYPKFTAAVLYNRILCRLQNWMPEGRELQKAPLHVVLTQNQALPSSIQLSVNPKLKRKPISLQNPFQFLEPISLRSPFQSLGSQSPDSSESNERTDSEQGSGSSPMSSLHSADDQFPRILLSVRLKEDLTPELSADLFAEWLRMMPVVANSVTIEAGFSSFSTLILVSMPTPMWVCLGKNPAFNLVGIIKKKPNIRIVSASTCSPLEVAESDNYQSLKTKQQPPARMSDESPPSAYTTMSSMQTPFPYVSGFDKISPYPSSSSYHYSTTAAKTYTPSQAPPTSLSRTESARYRKEDGSERKFASEIVNKPIDKSRKNDQLTKMDDWVAESHKLSVKSTGTLADRVSNKNDKTRGSGWLNLQTNRAAMPTAPLTGRSVNNIAPIPRFACHFIGCGRSFVSQDNRDRHMKRHGAPLESVLEPLAMSETKEVLMKYLHIDSETYALMEKETDVIYRWLISDTTHLINGETESPYNVWNFTEQSWDGAMRLLDRIGTGKTSSYWNLARPTAECPNWIAQWFLSRRSLNRKQKNRNVGGTNNALWPSVSSQYSRSQSSLYSTGTDNQGSYPSTYTTVTNYYHPYPETDETGTSNQGSYPWLYETGTNNDYREGTNQDYEANTNQDYMGSRKSRLNPNYH
ncbi:putative glucose-methanol-choline oxidoreductase protein [Botrytis fragariae]|uniref:Putative glucose-methanol-choline oxidoreductase protein n=1 Tax=Botrytis fragariae TaxID=1964551 RepID=A0A8H6AZY5_9HELO|nr:putative glucose-methanol-choline oxidoreductase protein [Botrytis fragariae]KAF5876582.1 putative glucose-methanol-choline oxidoreductase protein [Botrytis fragariae]